MKPFFGVVLCSALLFSADSVIAQESTPNTEGIRWRNDYEAAKQEAKEKSRPIFMVIGSDSCSMCKRLEAFTLRDNRIVRFLNEKLISVKIDGNQEWNLIQALKIRAYPTLIVADQHGRILKVHEGFQDAKSLEAVVRQSIESQKPAEKSTVQIWLEIAKADLDKGRVDRCLEMCDRVLEDATEAADIQECQRILAHISNYPKAYELAVQKRLELVANNELRMAKKLLQDGKMADARKMLDHLIDHHPKSVAATEAKLERLRQGSELQSIPAKLIKP